MELPMRLACLCLAALIAAAPARAAETAADPAPSLETLQRQLDEQRAQLEAQQARLDALAAELEQEPVAASATTIGGYGELHYNALDSKDTIDFHRFVLFFAHDFDDDLRFFAELELEHALAGEGKKGEVELEQAYVEMDLGATTRLRAGLFLVPVGILNETHEPPTFYGVERNPIESSIIPSTWWEAGVQLSGSIGDSGFGYDVALHSGLKTDATFNLRSGRQKVSEAVANDLATTARLKYTGVPGLELAASLTYQPDVTQGLVAGAGAATLFSAHAAYASGPLSARLLWAQWDLEGAAPAAAGKQRQDGYYAEGGWKLLPTLGAFVRFSAWDNGGVGATERTQTNLGINWWPHPDVVLKLDLQDQGKSVDDDGLNLGVGYRF
jgi:phosphate-selective porin